MNLTERIGGRLEQSSVNGFAITMPRDLVKNGRDNGILEFHEKVVSPAHQAQLHLSVHRQQ
jgi:hypothetical protein